MIYLSIFLLFLQVEDSTKIDGRKFEEKEFTCSVCMELVSEEELIRRLPCSHEVIP